jgi:hypothetical protein
MDWKTNGGTIINKSGVTLIVAFDHPREKGWGYMLLSHNRMTPDNLDADGFRVRDEGVQICYENPGTARLGWWKIRNRMVATVYAGRDNKGVFCVHFEAETKPFSASSLGSLVFSIGAAVCSPDPKTNEDFGWTGKNILLPENSLPVN